MCLIVSSEKGKLIDLADLKIAFDNNPDGAGIMWFEEGRVHQMHTLPKSFAEVRDLAEMKVGFPHAIHLRYCTRGKVNEENCHPFSVLNKDAGDDNDLTLMHNGTFQWLTLTDEHKKLDWSDTAAFAGRLQKNLRESKVTSKIHLDHLFDDDVVERFSKRVQTWNKVVFLDSQGRWSYLNKTQGDIRNDMWYSNTYSLKAGYRDKQAYHHGPTTKQTFVAGAGTTTAYGRSGTVYGNGQYSGQSTTDSSKVNLFEKERKIDGKVDYTFQRSSTMENHFYLVSSNGDITNWQLFDASTQRLVKTGNRLGSRERKRFRAWLSNEKKQLDAKTERKFQRKQESDSKGRKIHTVTSGERKDVVTTSATKPVTEISTPGKLDNFSTKSNESDYDFDNEDTIPLYELASYFEREMFH